MQETFYATIKMITGEEVLAEVTPTTENGVEMFLLSNPIAMTENISVDEDRGAVVSGLTPKKWMLYSSDDMILIRKDHVITMSELDRFGISFYTKALITARVSSPVKRKMDVREHSGYLGATKDYIDYLERMYKESPDIPT